MERMSFEQWQIPQQIEGVLHVEDFQALRGPTGLSARHHHAELELHLVLRGTGTYLMGNDRFTAEPGTLVWIPPESDHILLEAPRDFFRWLLLFRPEVTRRVLGAQAAAAVLTRAVPRSLARTLPKPLARALAAVFAEVHDQGTTSFPLHNAGIQFALARSWVLFSRAVSTPERAELHPAVARAARMLRDETEPLTMKDLGRRCGVSSSWLSRLFADQMGLTITDFRNRRRVERFIELFGEGHHVSVSDAALDAGFGSYAQFYRVFQGTVGCTPAEYARRLRRQ